ncbi:MAG: gamma-glutamylcyclotransferase family protein [Desulfovibrionaceae bacterium]
MHSDHLVFVYGTLRRGGSNHRLIADSEFLGRARTASPYALYVGLYPFVVKQLPVSPIRGEVYRVDHATIERLDELEDHPEVYCREEADVVLDDGSRLRAWLYFHPHLEGRRVPGGDYANWPGSGVT